MNTKQFHIGDRVIAESPIAGLSSLKGKTGTVIYISPDQLGIEFDEPFDEGHSCNGRGRNFCCRYTANRDAVSIISEDVVETESETLNEFLKEYKLV